MWVLLPESFTAHTLSPLAPSVSALDLSRTPGYFMDKSRSNLKTCQEQIGHVFANSRKYSFTASRRRIVELTVALISSLETIPIDADFPFWRNTASPCFFRLCTSACNFRTH